MDPKTRLEYALFQLTPTRTRCDLVVCSKGRTEKLASGLVEPFILQIKFFKDQIAKGGYSITLRPPSSNASWFTKSTFLRFVRFVSDPEVVERFVRLEREIQQIESSIESNKLLNTRGSEQGADGSVSAADVIIKKPTDSNKSPSGSERSDDVIQEENSKIRLQRLLATRKVLLRKEQAMAYARALVAGFDMDNLDDLISFADAFGASRLREACIDFKALWQQKNTDSLWMDELAAVEVCSPADLSYMGTSGIILACDNGGSTVQGNFQNGSSDTPSSDTTASQENSDSNKDNNITGASDQISSTPTKVPVQMQWANQIPQFMYNNQSPGQQMLPPYQGYPFPGMPPVHPYYQGNMGWPPNMDESSHGRRWGADYHHSQKPPSSRKKEKSSSKKDTADSTEEEEDDDEQIESSNSDSGRDSDVVHKSTSSRKQSHKKKNNRKSSKTVVIRNINYITSKRRNDEKGDDVSDDPSSSADDEGFLKEKVDEAVASLERHHKERGKHKKPSHSNGSSGSTGQDLETDPLTNISVEGKRKENWGAFQDLLMRDESNQQPVDVQDAHFMINGSNNAVDFVGNAVDMEMEKVTMQRTAAADSFVVATDRDAGYESRVGVEDFSAGENFRPSIKTRDCADEQYLFTERSEESGSFPEKSSSYHPTDSAIIRNGHADDWYMVENSGKSENPGAAIGRTDISMVTETEKSKKIVPIDDSFMVTGSAFNDHYDSQWRSDISMVADLNANNGVVDISQEKVGLSASYEPDDLCMVLVRDGGLDSVTASWTPEMDFETEIPFTAVNTNTKLSNVETNGEVEEKVPLKTKEVATNGKKTVVSKTLRGSLAKSTSDILYRSKKPSLVNRTIVHKSKSEQEEDARKKMEELSIQRQKRIAERSATKGSSAAMPKKPAAAVGGRTGLLKNDKLKPQSMAKKPSSKAIGV